LRFDIFKALIEGCESSVQEYCLYRDGAVSINKPTVRLYSVEDIEERYNPDLFIQMLIDLDWHEMLSIIEFYLDVGPIDADEVNQLFEYHKVAYRIESGYLGSKDQVVVYYSELIDDNNQVLDIDIPYKAVKESIEAARNYLTNPQNIDIANSIKSSVNAVEGYLKGYFSDKGKKLGTLGDCIKELKNDNSYPTNIISCLKQLYIYRNQTDDLLPLK